MKKLEATGRIRITKTPRGEAPEEVRKAWVGLTLPCYPVAGQLPGKMLGVVTGKTQNDEKPCGDSYDHFVVPQTGAIAELEQHAPEAAAWWRDHGFPRKFAANFAFRLDEADIISGVTMQPIRELTDEMMGDPNR